MSNLETDIKNAIQIVNSTVNELNKYNKMIEYSRLYYNTTENVKEYMMYCNGDSLSALIPSASGDQLIEAILHNYTNITCFDINRLAKYYVKLKITAIACLNKEEYINFFYDDFFNIDIFNYLKNNLDDDTRIFWEEIFKNVKYNRMCFLLFRCLAATNNRYSGLSFFKYCAYNYTSLLSGDNYKSIQNKMGSIDINFIDSDLDKLSYNLDEKYDFINLTNIYEYTNKCPFSGNDKVFADIVRRLIDNNLNDDGKLLISYLYRCCLADLYKYKDKPLIYAKILNFINNFDCLKKTHDKLFEDNKLNSKLSSFRRFQLLRWLDDIDINAMEVDELELGNDYFDKDLVLVYMKKNKK